MDLKADHEVWNEVANGYHLSLLLFHIVIVQAIVITKEALSPMVAGIEGVVYGQAGTDDRMQQGL